MEKFEIDKRLQSDSTLVVNLNLCQVRLHHNAAFPWIMLVPMQNNLKEIVDLSKDDQLLLSQEISLASKVIKKLYNPTKLNVANLGNLVPQLHIHVIARYDNDAAWPNPVWNSGFTANYQPDDINQQIEIIAATFLQTL